MKEKIFSTVFFLFAFLFYGNATTYYLSSSSGDDTNSGTNSVTPWKTLNHLNTVTLFPGDSVLLKSNDTFFGTIILNNSGVFNNPIYFGKYGIGNLPIITGFKKLTGWNNIGNIYSVTDSNYVRSIWLNGKWMQPAKHPNNGFFYTEGDGFNNLVYNGSFTEPDNYFKNAEVVVRSVGFKYEMARVDSFYNGYFLFDHTTAPIPQLNGFYLQNLNLFLDTVNEWIIDTSLNQINIIPPINININNADAEASILNYGFYSYLNESDIIIDSIEFQGQSIDAIHFENVVHRINIRNCKISKCKERAISFMTTSTNVLINNNFIEDCSGQSIYGNFFFGCKIYNNRISRTGMNVGFGFTNYYSGNAIYLESAIFDTISSNVIDSSSYAAIHFYQFNNLIEKNFINHSMLKLDGGGGILLDPTSHRNRISQNFILNTRSDLSGTKLNFTRSNGIFLNDACYLDTILNNTIGSTDSYGIFLTGYNQYHLIKDNTIYNNQYGQIYINDGYQLNTTTNILLQHNILYSLNDKQPTIQLSGNDYAFLPIKGDSNYYCNPYDNFPIHQQSDFDSVLIDKPFSLASWNQLTLQDSNSHVSNVQWQNYVVTDTTGNELITNGEFSNNYDYWTTQPDTNNSILLDNLTMMDGGCLKFEVTDTIPYDYSKLISTPFLMEENQFYQLSYSISGTKEGILFSNIIQNYSPYGEIGLNKYFPIETSRKDVSYIFQSQRSDNPMVLDFYLHKSDSLVYFDNIHLLPVTVFKHDSTRMSVLLMNYSPNTTTVTLPSDSVFRDLDGNIVPGSYTLPPYSSYVLVLDSPLNLVSVKEIQKENSITIFPNPVQSALGKIFIQLPDADKYDFEIYDVLGQKQQNGKFSVATMNSVSVKNYSAGLYILNIHSAKKQWQQKIIVVN